MKITYCLRVLVLILTGISAFVNASDRNAQLGIRAGLNVNKLSITELRSTDTDMREGFSVGLTTKTSLTKQFSFVPEVNFCYRVLGSYKFDFSFLPAPEEYTIDEMSISIPIMVHFVPVENVPFYLAAGIQFDFPFNCNMKITTAGKSVSESMGRISRDFYFPFGLGYMVTPSLGIDSRFYYFDKLFYDYYGYGRTTFWSFGFGVSYFLKIQ